jgi:hypothetical protein
VTQIGKWSEGGASRGPDPRRSRSKIFLARVPRARVRESRCRRCGGSVARLGVAGAGVWELGSVTQRRRKSDLPFIETCEMSSKLV